MLLLCKHRTDCLTAGSVLINKYHVVNIYAVCAEIFSLPKFFRMLYSEIVGPSVRIVRNFI